MVGSTKKAFRTGSIRRTVKIKAPKKKVWRRISDIAGMPAWAEGVKTVTYATEKKRGIGAVRLITFGDGTKIEEHIIAWRNGESFSYVATEGLPVRVYVATISLNQTSKDTTSLRWESYINSEKMTKVQFSRFIATMEQFYESSLDSLREKIEGSR